MRALRRDGGACTRAAGLANRGGRAAVGLGLALAGALPACTLSDRARPVGDHGAMEWVGVGAGQSHFALAGSGTPFTPWGFNYDHDENGRLLEDYWEAEWPKVVEDFREMRALGANVVRVHLQFGRFMSSPRAPDRAALERLRALLKVAEELGLRLDVTGLGCYRKEDVPAWYDALGEEERWAAQAEFWRAIAGACAASPAVFCYDLMNEPVVPGGRRVSGDWLGPPFAGKYHYVQFITLDADGRDRSDVAKAWIRTLADAIRTVDRRHLITVGLVPWSLDRPGLTSGFVPERIAPELDFVSVHLYPESGGVEEALSTLAGFAVGKPVVIEETFPLRCSFDAMRQFLRGSRQYACGWISFYWGRTPEEYRAAETMQDALVGAWIEAFAAREKLFGP